jgi:hypothetical protein
MAVEIACVLAPTGKRSISVSPQRHEQCGATFDLSIKEDDTQSLVSIPVIGLLSS